MIKMRVEINNIDTKGTKQNKNEQTKDELN